MGRVLGESHFAIVYAAVRQKDNLACAIKEYYPRDLAQRSLDNKTVKPKFQQKQLNIAQYLDNITLFTKECSNKHSLILKAKSQLHFHS